MANRKLSTTASTLENSVSFLQTEFRASIDQWQHFNERLDREVQYYLSSVGILIAASGLLLQVGVNFATQLIAIHVLLMIVLVAGFRLLRRIVHLSYLMAELNAQVALIRRYFMNLDKSIEAYLILIAASKDGPAHAFPPVSTQISVRIVSIVNSFVLASFIFVIPFHFYLSWRNIFQQATWVIVFMIAGLLSITIGLSFFRYQKIKLIRRYDRMMEEISVMVKQNLQQVMK